MTKDKLKELFAVECTETDGKGVTVIKGTPMDIINWINDKLDQETQRLKAESEKVKAEKEELIDGLRTLGKEARDLREHIIDARLMDWEDESIEGARLLDSALELTYNLLTKHK